MFTRIAVETGSLRKLNLRNQSTEEYQKKSNQTWYGIFSMELVIRILVIIKKVYLFQSEK
jgi:hypothetical protein